MRRLLTTVAAAGFAIGVLGACAPSHQQRLGLVTDPDSGLAYGSVVDGTLVTDPAFYDNRRIKIRIRNTSGDAAFDLHGFRSRLVEAYRAKGYEPTDGDDFGLLLDVNVAYSGLIQDDLRREFAFLGAAWGGGVGAVKGAESGRPHGTPAGAAMGTVTGAAIGAVIGSFVRENTYVVVSRATFGVRRKKAKTGRVVTFSRSLKVERDPQRLVDGLRKAFDIDVAVYGGARTNVQQAEVSDEVRHRLVRIVSDVF